ncbi:saccharolysin [Anaeramoeba ignava]|uniref:Saccharolysin n=1 Tax=Anaeramoeba ignava TaxID=1746090 RepID=A0A9Q0LCP1_ANAIG|nr:saccharolysin [Anaeramoeba ignava]
MECLKWNYTPEQITTKTDEIIAKSQKTHDEIAKLKKGENTYTNTLLALIEEEREGTNWGCIVGLLSETYPDAKVRDASREADEKLSKFWIDMSMREDVFISVKNYQETLTEELDHEQKRFLERLIRDFKRNGLDLEKEKREEMKSKKKKITENSIKYSKNLNEDKTKLLFDKQELEGLNEDLINELEKQEEKYVITLKYPHVFPILEKCKVGNTRKKVLFEFNSRSKEENTKLFEETLELRHQIAKLLGFQNHAEFALDIRMAKKPETVMNFLDSLCEKLPGESELEVLRKLKREELKIPDDQEVVIEDWDFRYYHKLLLETKYQVDDNVISQYFPLEKVIEGMLEIYQQVLGLDFKQVAIDFNNPEEKMKVWHEEVKLFEIYDSEKKDFVGHFYLDLFPREGKYGHAAEFSIRHSCKKPDGTRQYPIAAMVCNFTKPTKDKPSLLQHSEVETMFHEFGHLMHELCSTVDIIRFSGTNVDLDFVETPSQMCENWVWQEDSLKKISLHYKSNDPLPIELIQKMTNAKNVDAGLFYRRQLFFGIFDQNVHSQEKSDTYKLTREIRKKICLIEQIEGTTLANTFGHLMSMYDAGYYSYLWSEVFSHDIFQRFKKEGLLSSVVGKQLRQTILSQGAKRDAMELLKEFLGREPNEEAFLESIFGKK